MTEEKFDFCNADGLATGVYVYTLRAEAAGEVHQAVGRMLLMK